MASWEDEDEVAITSGSVANNWEDEDEDDDDIKDNWDDDDEEEPKKAPAAVEVKPKKKKTLEEKIKEKEAKKRLEEEDLVDDLTPEEIRRKQEEDELKITMETFGPENCIDVITPVVVAPPPLLPGERSIDNFKPQSKEDFNEFSKLLQKKFASLEKEKQYPSFLENFFRDCCAGMEADHVKKISTALNAVSVAQQKQKQVAKAKAKPATKSNMKVGKATKNYDDDRYDDDAYDDSYSFM